MIKQIRKIGNSQGLIFDSALLELTHLKAGDAVNVEVHEGGTISLTPIRRQPTEAEIDEAVNRVMEDYADTLRKLA